jgi:hypothetical protein
MKLSVSVPDALWEKAQTKRPDLKDSHLVQEALESFTKPADTAGFSLAMPDDAKEAFEVAREHLATMARAQFEDGYRAAVEAIPHLGWWNVQGLAEDHFDVKSWARSLVDSNVNAKLGNIPEDWGTEDKVIGALIKPLGSLLPPYGDNSPRPSIPFLRGFTQAFRDLWEQVNAGEIAPEPAAADDEEGALGQ